MDLQEKVSCIQYLTASVSDSSKTSASGSALLYVKTEQKYCH